MRRLLFLLLLLCVVSLEARAQVPSIPYSGFAESRFARIVRASVLEENEKDYVLAARAVGARNRRILFNTVLPNCMAPIIVQASLGFGSAILDAAGLSFLGLGAQPPIPEWGAMIAMGRSMILRAWWVMTFPGIAILLGVLGFNLLGDGLRDALDPRLRD